MRILIEYDGKIVIEEGPHTRREATPQDLITYAAEIEAARDALSDPEQMSLQIKAIVKALVKVINLRFLASQKITAAELKQAIKEEAH